MGGYIPPISSTELLVETASAWEFAGNLPSPRTGLRAANIDTKILVTGQWGRGVNPEALAATVLKSLSEVSFLFSPKHVEWPHLLLDCDYNHILAMLYSHI